MVFYMRSLSIVGDIYYQMLCTVSSSAPRSSLSVDRTRVLARGPWDITAASRQWVEASSPSAQTAFLILLLSFHDHAPSSAYKS